MMKDFVMPIVVLSLICLLVSGALAVVNDITYPVIKEAAIERAFIAKQEIIPSAEDFVLIDSDEFPRAVAEAYRTSNDVGYIFTVSVIGYGGDIRMLCGINNNGEIIKTTVLSHTETQGLGTIVFEHRAAAYAGMNYEQAMGLDAIAGSTITSVAYKRAVEYAFQAYEIITR
jgi:electron transport complex protein RnfG